MGKPYDHQYLDTRSTRCGTMKCAGCGQLITHGAFRAYKKPKHGDWGYVTYHKACCATDPQWARIDAEASAQVQRLRDLLTAAEAFREQWGISDLDDLIVDLRSDLPTAEIESQP